MIGRRRRPGPSQLPPNQMPGGKVAHVYDNRGRLLLVRSYLTAEEATRRATEDAEIVGNRIGRKAALVVVYDGTTGERQRNGAP